MSGAKLQAVGQLRDSYPYIVNVSAKTTLTLAAGTLSPLSPLNVPDLQIPFDRGPDKAARVFITFNGVYVSIISSGAYTPTNPLITGGLFFQALDGNKTYLAALAAGFATPLAVNGHAFCVTPSFALSAERVSSLGSIGFEDSASVLGSAPSIVINVYLNIGLYGEYAEYDFDELKCPHHAHVFPLLDGMHGT